MLHDEKRHGKHSRARTFNHDEQGAVGGRQSAADWAANGFNSQSADVMAVVLAVPADAAAGRPVRRKLALRSPPARSSSRTGSRTLSSVQLRSTEFAPSNRPTPERPQTTRRRRTT